MGWQLKAAPKTHRVTRKLAREFAEMDPAPHDRPLSERRLQVYQRLFGQGGFRPCTWARASCAETGGLYRVNGKHTSTLLAGVDPLPEYYVTVEDYACDTLEDVAKLYATFDSKMQSRTVSDINLSFAATVPELAPLPARVINLAVAGMGYHLWEGSVSRHHQPAERAELLLEYPEFLVWLADVLAAGAEAEGRRNSRHLMRQPVVAAMFATWQKAGGPASEFWLAVRDETGPAPTLPDRKLARYLLTVGVDSGGGARYRVRRADSREFYVKCIHAWNAWRKGEKTDLRYYAEAGVPALR